MDGSVKIGDFGLVTAVEENCMDDAGVDGSKLIVGCKAAY
jgi:hypothetical protein